MHCTHTFLGSDTAAKEVKLPEEWLSRTFPESPCPPYGFPGHKLKRKGRTGHRYTRQTRTHIHKRQRGEGGVFTVPRTLREWPSSLPPSHPSWLCLHIRLAHTLALARSSSVILLHNLAPSSMPSLILPRFLLLSFRSSSFSSLLLSYFSFSSSLRHLRFCLENKLPPLFLLNSIFHSKISTLF